MAPRRRLRRRRGRRRQARGARAGPSRGRLRGPPAQGEAAARLPLRGRLRRRDGARPTTPTASCPPSASSTCTSSARAATRRCGRSSARTCASWRACAAPRSPSGRRPRSSVSVVGDFNYWDGRMHPMRSLGSSGIWEVFLPGVDAGARYKFEILTPDGEIRLKADPMAFEAEVPPKTASVVHEPTARVGRRGVAALAPRERAAGGPDLGLRGPPGLLAAEPDRGQPLAELPRAGRRARRLRARHGVHPHRADAGDGAPVLGLLGLPGDELLRAHAAASARPTTSESSSTACTRTGSA